MAFEQNAPGANVSGFLIDLGFYFFFFPSMVFGEAQLGTERQASVLYALQVFHIRASHFTFSFPPLLSPPSSKEEMCKQKPVW